MHPPTLTLLTLTPLAGALVVCLGCRRTPGLARKAAIGFSAAAFVQAVLLWIRFDPSLGRMQFEEEYRWIPSLDVHYHLGVDGLGLVMVLLSAIVVPMAQLLANKIEDREPLFHGLVLFLQSGLFGAFTALNFYHWFIFWELSLIPAYFLIKLWGGRERVPAATQFFLYTMAGSVAMLLGFQIMYLATSSFDFQVLGHMGASGELARQIGALRLGPLHGHGLVMLVFVAVLLGFAVKVPLMPFHTWLPAAYTEAPCSVTMILTGAMSKMGVYGFLRILLPLFPAQIREANPLLLWLAIATVVLSACAAFAQKDIKRMLAYSSINHLGYCLLAVFAVVESGSGSARLPVERAFVLNGVVLQMFNHGITAATLFCFVGFLERRNGGTRGVDSYGGLRAVAPVFAGLMGISLFASIGLPGLNGFVGEFLIFSGVFALQPWAAALSALGLLVTAVFLLTLIQKVFFGPLPDRWKGFADLTTGERLLILPATGLMFLIGVWPQSLCGVINETTRQMVLWLGR